jgi:uncharacterized membrane protein
MTGQNPDDEDQVDGGATERLTFFSDAVVAIALTLLALELPTPQGFSPAELWRSLGDHFDAYLAFCISFVVIAAHWFAHHGLFRWLARTDAMLRSLNMAWLFTIVITPWATRVVSESQAPPPGVVDTSQAARFALYAAVQVATNVVFLLMVLRMSRAHLLRRTLPAGRLREAYWRSGSIGLGFAVSIPVFFLTDNAWLIWIVVPSGIGWTRRMIRRGSGPGGRDAAARKPAGAAQ